MAGEIKIKYSNTANAIPALVSGEIAINQKDEKLFYRTDLGVIKSKTLLSEIGIGGGSSSGATLKSVTVSNVPYNTIYYSATITDASVTSSTKIMVDWGNVLDSDENSPEMDEVKFLAVAGTGNFELRMFTNDRLSRLGGTYKINYLIQ